MAKEADHRALLDLGINMLAERESTKTLAVLQRISSHLGVAIESDMEAMKLAGETNMNALAKALDEKIS